MIFPIREHLKRQPNDALAYRKIALLLFLSADQPGALEAFREAARVDPEDAACRRWLGILLFAQEDMPDAIAAFREAIGIDPMRPDDRYTLAAALDAHWRPRWRDR